MQQYLFCRIVAGTQHQLRRLARQRLHLFQFACHLAAAHLRVLDVFRGKFGDVLAATRTTLERAAKNIENAEVRSRQMARKLKSVEALPSEAAQLMLGAGDEALDQES